MSKSNIVEHVVLLKLKDDAPPSDSAAVVDRINSLATLQHLLNFTMAPLLRVRSFPSSSPLNFTHILHARYNSKHDLDAYTVHPRHVAVVKANAPLLDDSMGLDWVVDDLGLLVPPPGSAVRVAFFKLKEDRVRGEVLRAVREIHLELNQAVQVTCGENFSPGRAKGFSIASIAVFPGLTELEAADSAGDYEKNDKIKEHLESVLVFDFVVPSPPASG